MPSSGETRPAIQAGTNIASSETLGPRTAARMNGPGVIRSAGMAVPIHLAHRLRQQQGPAQSGRNAQRRSRHAHRQPFQEQHADQLPAGGADRPQHGQLSPPLAHVHQERVEDHEERQGQDHHVGEVQALLDFFNRFLGELRPLHRRADAEPVGQDAANRLGDGLFVGVVGHHDADHVDVAGLVEQALGRVQRQEDRCPCALLEAGGPARRKQPDDLELSRLQAESAAVGSKFYLIAYAECPGRGQIRFPRAPRIPSQRTRPLPVHSRAPPCRAPGRFRSARDAALVLLDRKDAIVGWTARRLSRREAFRPSPPLLHRRSRRRRPRLPTRPGRPRSAYMSWHA